jgi:hypothetical protein
LGWVTYGSSRLILVGLGNLRFLQVNRISVGEEWHHGTNTTSQKCRATHPV